MGADKNGGFYWMLYNFIVERKFHKNNNKIMAKTYLFRLLLKLTGTNKNKFLQPLGKSV